MTDHIIKAAKEAEAYATSQTNDIVDWKAIAQERFYAIAFKQGMERAAEICERVWPSEDRSGHEWTDGFADGTCDCADAIRAHAQNQPENVHDGSDV